ncbi:XIAP-associated factor 1, partial [Calypte anna]
MTEESRFCTNCKRDVSAANFSIHTVHCLRFLTLCPECDEPVSQKDMEDHQKEAHNQVREASCSSGRKYDLEFSPTSYIKLMMHTLFSSSCHSFIRPKVFNRLCSNSFLDSGISVLCFSKTNDCIDGNLCQKCNKSFPDNQYFQHLVSTFETEQENVLDLPKPLSLAPASSSGNAVAWRDVRPKEKGRDQSLISKTLLKHPKNKKIGSPSTTIGGLSTSPEALKDSQSFDMLVTCTHCNILLPLPALQKHEV